MKKSIAIALFVILSFFTIEASAQTIQSNFLIVASGGQVQIQKIANSTTFTVCLTCNYLLANCLVTCALAIVVDTIVSSNVEDVVTLQVVKFDNGTFAIYNRGGLTMSGAAPITLIFDWGSLHSGRDALLDALYA